MQPLDIVCLSDLQHSDSEFVRQARNQSRHYFLSQRFILEHEQREWLLENLNNTDRPFFIIQHFGQRVGTISVNYKTGEIGNVLVLKEHRGKNIGKRAMHIAIGMVESRELKPFVDIQDRFEIKKFYANLGFLTKYVRMEKE